MRRSAGLLLFFGAWEATVRSGAVSADHLPGLGRIGESLVKLLESADFWAQFGLTCQRVAIGLACALALGLGMAACVAHWSLLRRMTAPFFDMLRSLPPPALIPLLIFVFGIGQPLFYFIVVFAALWPIFISASNALATAEPVQLSTARTLGYSEAQILARVRIPAAMPEIMSGVRLGAAIALLATVASEMLVGGTGLGYLVYDAGFSMLMPRMYALMIVVGVSGLALNFAMVMLSRALVGWQIRWSAQGEAT